MIKFIVFPLLVGCRRCLFYMSLFWISPRRRREKKTEVFSRSLAQPLTFVVRPPLPPGMQNKNFTQIYLSQRQNKHLKINSMTKTKACARAAFFQQLRDICTAVDLRCSPPPPARHAKRKFYTNIFIATAK